MNLRDLQYFVTVAETGHVGLAAKKCFISQPTLSVQLQKLESELGVQLFERQQKKLVLSSAGESLLQQALSIVHGVDEFKSLAKTQSDPYAGDFKLGIIPTICPYILPQVMQLVTEAMPKLSLQITEQQTAILIEQLETSKLDAAILATDESSASLDSILLYSEDFYYVSSSKDVVKHAKAINPKDLKSDSLLLLDDGHCLRDQGLSVCGNGANVANKNYCATSMTTLLALVAAGLGATLVPECIRSYYKNDARLIFLPLVKPIPVRNIYLVSRKSSTRSKCKQKLSSLLAKIKNSATLNQ